MKSKLFTIVLLGAAAAAAHATTGDPSAGQTKAATCTACHGANGVSTNPEWPNIAGQHARYIAKQLADYKAGTERNNAVMAGMVAALSETDMADLAAWFSTQAPAAGTADAALAEAGQRLFRGGNPETGVPACAGCHGPRGAGDPNGGIPRLAGQHADYTKAQLQAFHARDRQNDLNGMMRGTVRWMTDEEMDAVAAYIQGLY